MTKSAPQDLWKRIGAPLFFGRDEEVCAIAERLKAPGSIIELVAPVGAGKTSLLKHIALRHRQTAGGAVEYFTGSDAFPLSPCVDLIAERFAAEGGHHLLIIDSAEPLLSGDLLDAISRLSTGPWTFSTIIGSQCGKDLGEVVGLKPLPHFALKDAVESALQAPLDDVALELLWSATCGNAGLARELSERWRRLRHRDPAALIRLIEPLAAAGLVYRDGRPLQRCSVAKSELASVHIVSRALIDRIARDPKAVFSMAPHEFEELVADLLMAQGYQVSLTPRTRDGGKDIYAARREPVGSMRYVVECKRHAPDRAVDVRAVRALYGVAQHERVNAGIMMTTSYFTRPAQVFAETAGPQLSLHDYFDLRGLIQTSPL